MDPLRGLDPSDPVSRLLRPIRITTTLYCHSTMGAPWGFGVKAHGNPAFHIVTSGQSWLQVADEADQIALTAGDLVILTTGRRHWVRDDPTTETTELAEILATTPPKNGRRLHYGGDGPVTELLCGGFELESSASNPWLQKLPATLVVHGVDGRPAPWLAATLAMLRAATASDALGADYVVSRLTEILLAQALRVAVIESEGTVQAWPRVLHDAQIAAAIGLIHSRPDRNWTVGALADEVALSRSTFAGRFHALVGESPMRYIARTRLGRAAELLRSTDTPLTAIAASSGYRSAPSFAKAFKRAFGTPPGAYRKQPTRPPNLELDSTGISEDIA